MKRFVLFGTIGLVFLVADQATKIWAADRLSHGCPKLAQQGDGAPELARCHDDAPRVRLQKPTAYLEAVTDKGKKLTLRCAGGSPCLAGELGLSAKNGRADADGDLGRIAPGTIVTVRTGQGPDASMLRFGYERGGKPIVLIEGYFEFEYAENRGAAWSFLADKPGIREPVLISVAVLAVLLLGWWVYKLDPSQRMLAVALGLLFSGAVGNLIDRVRLGYVIDFILFHIKDGFRWPNFNVADIAIVVGVGLLAIDSIGAWMRERREKRTKKAA